MTRISSGYHQILFLHPKHLLKADQEPPPIYLVQKHMAQIHRTATVPGHSELAVTTRVPTSGLLGHSDSLITPFHRWQRPAEWSAYVPPSRHDDGHLLPEIALAAQLGVHRHGFIDRQQQIHKLAEAHPHARGLARRASRPVLSRRLEVRPAPPQFCDGPVALDAEV